MKDPKDIVWTGAAPEETDEEFAAKVEAAKFPTIDALAVHTIEKANEHMAKQGERITELERENARLQMELDGMCNAEELRQVREENAKLREALTGLEKACCVRLPPDQFMKLADEISEARAAVQNR